MGLPDYSGIVRKVNKKGTAAMKPTYLSKDHILRETINMKTKITPIFISLILLLTACANPPSLFATATPTVTATPLPTNTPTVTPSPTVDPSIYGAALKDLTYCSPEGSPQKLDLYLPKTGGPWPILMDVHGGGWDKGDKAGAEGWKFLNEYGIAAVAVNYRLSGQKKFPAMIEDVKCAVRFLRANAAKYNLDPDRIVASGASAGGHLVSLLGLADESAGWDKGEYEGYSSRVSAVISMAGFSDFTREVYSTVSMTIRYATGSMPGTPNAINIAASPVSYITSDDPPFLILHGDKDGTSPLEQSQVLHEALTKAGVASTLVVIKNGPHNFEGANMEPSKEEFNQMILDFIMLHLLKSK